MLARSRNAIEPSLRRASPENGNNGEDTRRFSAMWPMRHQADIAFLIQWMVKLSCGYWSRRVAR